MLPGVYVCPNPGTCPGNAGPLHWELGEVLCVCLCVRGKERRDVLGCLLQAHRAMRQGRESVPVSQHSCWGWGGQGELTGALPRQDLLAPPGGGRKRRCGHRCGPLPPCLAHGCIHASPFTLLLTRITLPCTPTRFKVQKKLHLTPPSAHPNRPFCCHMFPHFQCTLMCCGCIRGAKVHPTFCFRGLEISTLF